MHLNHILLKGFLEHKCNILLLVVCGHIASSAQLDQMEGLFIWLQTATTRACRVGISLEDTEIQEFVQLIEVSGRKTIVLGAVLL